MTKDTKPEVKIFSLKTIEKDQLEFIRQNNQRTFAGFLSYIAVERIGYPVTELTQFELTDDFKELKISEFVPPVAEPESSPVVPGK